MPTNKIDYITIASAGDASDFGDLTDARSYLGGGIMSSTRGVWMGGVDPSVSDIMDYVTTASTGNATDFGNLTVGRTDGASCCSATRAITHMGGEADGGGMSDVIDYVTTASTGNATDFGNLTVAKYQPGGNSNNIRCVCVGGYISPADQNVIEYITIASTGNGADFGDISTGNRATRVASDAHGGL